MWENVFERLQQNIGVAFGYVQHIEIMVIDKWKNIWKCYPRTIDDRFARKAQAHVGMFWVCMLVKNTSVIIHCKIFTIDCETLFTVNYSLLVVKLCSL
jgi:DNA-directed RNA polymerase subunit E'/Rpb7